MSRDKAEAARAFNEAFETIERGLMAWTRGVIAEGGEQRTDQEKPSASAKKR
jgi:hypothetical protein